MRQKILDKKSKCVWIKKSPRAQIISHFFRKPEKQHALIWFLLDLKFLWNFQILFGTRWQLQLVLYNAYYLYNFLKKKSLNKLCSDYFQRNYSLFNVPIKNAQLILIFKNFFIWNIKFSKSRLSQHIFKTFWVYLYELFFILILH